MKTLPSSTIPTDSLDTFIANRDFFENNEDIFTSLYIVCFAEPPYCEKFSHTEVLRMAYHKWFTPEAIMLATTDNRTNLVYTYLVAYRLTLEPDVCSAIQGHVTPSKFTKWLYVAEVMTHPAFRGQGLASNLLRTLREITKKRCCDHLVMRTSSDNHASRGLFAKQGFTLIEKASEEVHHTRTTEQEDTDQRIFMEYHHQT